jgi:ribonuclease Z
MQLNCGWILYGYSRAAKKSGFFISGVNLAFDAGYFLENKVNTVFITHPHWDHVADLGSILFSNKNTTIMLAAPDAAKKNIESLIKCISTVNYNRSSRFKYQWSTGKIRDNLFFETFPMDHSISSIGYGIIEERKKLKPEYQELSQKEIISLKKSGKVVDETYRKRLFAYLGDTCLSSSLIETWSKMKLFSYPEIMIECTFIHPEDIEDATKKKHIHWKYLKPLVTSHPDIKFILYHFSKKYDRDEVISFFQSEGVKLTIWIDDKYFDI